jgi:hypothetical protein
MQSLVRVFFLFFVISICPKNSFAQGDPVQLRDVLRCFARRLRIDSDDERVIIDRMIERCGLQANEANRAIFFGSAKMAVNKARSGNVEKVADSVVHEIKDVMTQRSFNAIHRLRSKKKESSLLNKRYLMLLFLGIGVGVSIYLVWRWLNSESEAKVEAVEKQAADLKHASEVNEANEIIKKLKKKLKKQKNKIGQAGDSSNLMMMQMLQEMRNLKKDMADQEYDKKCYSEKEPSVWSKIWPDLVRCGIHGGGQILTFSAMKAIDRKWSHDDNVSKNDLNTMINKICDSYNNSAQLKQPINIIIPQDSTRPPQAFSSYS